MTDRIATSRDIAAPPGPDHFVACHFPLERPSDLGAG